MIVKDKCFLKVYVFKILMRLIRTTPERILAEREGFEPSKDLRP